MTFDTHPDGNPVLPDGWTYERRDGESPTDTGADLMHAGDIHVTLIKDDENDIDVLTLAVRHESRAHALRLLVQIRATRAARAETSLREQLDAALDLPTHGERLDALVAIASARETRG